ncbi:hypothetical protein [Mucilaginibacter sp. KACC 22063]|uniref:hypothetical protein n=1 Tax=Mucilaginibacter sp. KACC 22063 TaxID=3025666 RepID=UPI0023673EEC|nr:hypothetical protein [Mucilaginibacter sp. KACC 22063]WDF54487.1 hypothetical protein PQ461_16240 [Mucilaginibacter sp. KACC 22063]
MRAYFSILVIGALFSSCFPKGKNVNEFNFYLPESKLHFTTSKVASGRFYVIISKLGNVNHMSDNVDYIECKVEDQILVIALDPNDKNRIYFKYPYIKKINKKHLDLIEMSPDAFKKKFYHIGSGTSPDTLKSQYRQLLIAPMSYHIIFQRDSIVDHQEVLKNGDM